MRLRDKEVGTPQTWKGSPHWEARKQIKTRTSLPTLIRVTKIKCDEPRDYQGCEKTNSLPVLEGAASRNQLSTEPLAVMGKN